MKPKLQSTPRGRELESAQRTGSQTTQRDENTYLVKFQTILSSTQILLPPLKERLITNSVGNSRNMGSSCQDSVYGNGLLRE
ncbi:hypothetical protein DSO57_1027091 [Entomophthora muscae]|uniref:Uncharacterized protein n=1 Tax=Entomophthora muscae TaxID=34485 RepID=A0ACC2U0F0_9FUNG|nr:hypothetical protein DSO57_1027091 [Entomophthora muscae]